jgi:hypothetical protein
MALSTPFVDGKIKGMSGGKSDGKKSDGKKAPKMGGKMKGK